MTAVAAVLEARRDAVALRRYVRERAAGRSATEWIVRDDSLQAVFATIEPDNMSACRRLWIDVDCSPSGCLAEWRARGRRLLAAVSGEPGAEGGTLAARFAERGTGKRSLAAV